MTQYSADLSKLNVSIDAATTTATGAAILLPHDRSIWRYTNIAWSTKIGGTGSFSALTVNLEGTIADPPGSDDWITLDTDTTCVSTTTHNLKFVTDKPVAYVRATITVATVGSGAPTATVGIRV